MAGGFYRPKGRNTYRIWFPWKGQKLFINKYLDGSSLYHPKQCERILEKIRGEIDGGIFDPASWGKDRVMQFQEAWRIYTDRVPVKMATEAQREMIFKTYLLPYFKDKGLTQIRTIDIEDWYSKISGDLKPSYRRLIVARLKGLFHYLSDSIPKMPKFTVVKVPKKSPDWLTEEEQERVIQYIPKQHQGILRFIKAYGCRSSEACNLRKSDIDWAKRLITFTERKNDRDNQLPILPQIEHLLKARKRIEHLECVFCTVRGAKYRRQYLYQMWIVANKKAHIKYGVKIVPLKNATRHSLACQLLEKDVQIPVIARILGNTPSVVERSYGNIRNDKVKDVLGAQTVHGGT